jgi:uncharacterized protein YprB with RNaseH-like and TPR domain
MSTPAVSTTAARARATSTGGSRIVRGQQAAKALGGAWCTRAEGPLIIVDRFYPAEARYGQSTIGAIVDRLVAGGEAFGVLGRVWPSSAGLASRAPTLAFLDTETTGLAGGAGTKVFLVGYASVDAGGLRVRQLLLPGFEHERALLAELASWSATCQGLVTFNGRTFDVPLIETRFLLHRLAFPLADVPHLDMLPPARRLWKPPPSREGRAPEEESCRLSMLERRLGGVQRVGDVPGFEIPSRYFQFVREGQARPLEAVLEHNRLDLLSLALITARALTLITHGPSAARHAYECLGLGRVYEQAGQWDKAEACYRDATERCQHAAREPMTHADALYRLARARRHTGRKPAAADAWRTLAELPGCPAELRREAREALAIDYEHRVHDLARAHDVTRALLAESVPDGWRQKAAHRLGRLERKQRAQETGTPRMRLDD